MSNEPKPPTIADLMELVSDCFNLLVEVSEGDCECHNYTVLSGEDLVKVCKRCEAEYLIEVYKKMVVSHGEQLSKGE